MTDTARHVILAGVDGSASSLHAVRWAAQEAGRRLHACTRTPKPSARPTVIEMARTRLHHRHLGSSGGACCGPRPLTGVSD